MEAVVTLKLKVAELDRVREALRRARDETNRLAKLRPADGMTAQDIREARAAASDFNDLLVRLNGGWNEADR